MTQLVLPRRFTQQPQQAVRIDRGNPSTNGLRLVLSGALPSRALVGPTVAQTGAVASEAGRYGRYQAFDGATQALSIPLDLSGTQAVTLLALVDVRNVSAGYDMFWEFTADGNSNTGGFTTYQESGTHLSTGTKSAAGLDADNYALPGIGNSVIAQVFDHAMPSGSQIGVYYNGVKKAKTAAPSVTGGAGAFANATLYIGARTASTLWSQINVGLFLLFDRRLSDGEIAALSANPWQIFQAPARRIWMATAAGSSTDTPINPAVGSLAITGYAPTITQPQAVSPGVGALSITGYAPTVTQAVNQAVNPDAGTLSITGYAPAIAQSVNQLLTPDAGSVALTGYAPSVAQSAHQTVAPGVGAITITGYAPSVTQESASRNVLPDVGSLEITGYAPTVTQSGQQTSGGYFPRKSKRGEYDFLNPPRRERVEEAPVEAVAAVIEVSQPDFQPVLSKRLQVALRQEARTQAKAAGQEKAWKAFYDALIAEEVERKRQQDEDDEAVAILLLM